MLLCVLCKDSFQSAWDLMVHVQAAHMMNIYELGVPKSDATVKGEQTSQQTSPATSPCPCPIHDKEVVSTPRTSSHYRYTRFHYPRLCFSASYSIRLVSASTQRPSRMRRLLRAHFPRLALNHVDCHTVSCRLHAQFPRLALNNDCHTVSCRLRAQFPRLALNHDGCHTVSC